MKWYHVVFVLRDNNGVLYNEEMKNMSISDFEVAYGNVTDEIMSVVLLQQKGYEA